MIVRIKQIKEKYYKVFADEEEIAIFNINTIEKLKIKNGFDYSIEYINKIKLIAKLKKAQRTAIEFLRCKDHSEKELYSKLKKRYSEKISKYVVLQMKKKGYVNDEKYAKNLAYKIIFTKNKGKNLAILELMRKGIDKEISNKAVESLNCNFVRELEKLILKKHKEKLENSSSRKKLFLILLRRGYSYNDINLAINNILN